MHEHNLNNIMALAEGTLDASEISAVEADIATCEQCSHDLESQKQALSALGSLPPVVMTEMESTRMRRALRDDLGIATAVAVTSEAVKTKRLKWYGAIAAAAVLILVVAVAPTLNLLGASDSGDRAALAPITTTAAASESADLAGETTVEDGGATMAPESPSLATTSAATSEAFAAPMSRLSPDTALADVLKSFDDNFPNPELAVVDQADDSGLALPSCSEVGVESLEAIGKEVFDVQIAGVWEVDGVDTIVVAYDTSDGVVVYAHDPVTCEVVAEA